MQLTTPLPDATEPVSKVKLALGAASLFLFIVGVKRSYDAGDDRSREEEHPEQPVKEGKRTRDRAARPRS
jgi:hypothetical protein